MDWRDIALPGGGPPGGSSQIGGPPEGSSQIDTTTSPQPAGRPSKKGEGAACKGPQKGMTSRSCGIDGAPNERKGPLWVEGEVLAVRRQGKGLVFADIRVSLA